MDTLVLVPGLGSDAAVWRPTIDALGTGHDCRVGETLRDDSLRGMAARILADAPPRFALAGVSMGGMVALEMMRVAPDRVTRLALFDTNARADTPEQSQRRRASDAAMLAADDLRALSAPFIAFMIHPGAERAVHDALADMTLRVGAAAYVRQNRAVAARDDLRPVLSGIAVPTMVAVGAQDLMTPPALAREMQEAIPGATLSVIPDCGHLPPIERPDATAALLREWLAR